ncbi:MAG: hypothetical protein HUJ76_12290, partial [Parasporobacterium sp.]|nr:hypothetical protein [Parasporobacterium sp.]
MSDAVKYTVPESANESGVYNYAVQNIYLGRTYYFNITADGDKVSDTHTFTVDEVPPRNLAVG